MLLLSFAWFSLEINFLFLLVCKTSNTFLSLANLIFDLQNISSRKNKFHWNLKAPSQQKDLQSYQRLSSLLHLKFFEFYFIDFSIWSTETFCKSQRSWIQDFQRFYLQYIFIELSTYMKWPKLHFVLWIEVEVHIEMII